MKSARLLRSFHFGRRGCTTYFCLYRPRWKGPRTTKFDADEVSKVLSIFDVKSQSLLLFLSRNKEKIDFHEQLNTDVDISNVTTQLGNGDGNFCHLTLFQMY